MKSPEEVPDYCEECGLPYAIHRAESVWLCDRCYAELFDEDTEYDE